MKCIEEVLSSHSPRNKKSKGMACFCVWQLKPREVASFKKMTPQLLHTIGFSF